MYLIMLENDHTLTYNAGDILSVTIAPEDKQQFFGKTNRVQLFHQLYHEQLTKLFDTKFFDYWFRIELSEPINEVKFDGPRLHLHGVIKLKDKLSVFKWLSYVMHGLLKNAILKINHIDSKDKLEGWIGYCIKQIRYMPTGSFISNNDDQRGDFMSLYCFKD